MDGDNTYTCSCFDGYKGTDCDGKSSEPFVEIFSCVSVTVVTDRVSNFVTIMCYCFICLEINPGCTNVTCQNGGSCLYVNETHNTVCVCLDSFVGEFCEGNTLSCTII